MTTQMTLNQFNTLTLNEKFEMFGEEIFTAKQFNLLEYLIEEIEACTEVLSIDLGVSKRSLGSTVGALSLFEMITINETVYGDKIYTLDIETLEDEFFGLEDLIESKKLELVEEVQAEEVQAEEVQAEEVQAEEVQAEEVQAEEVQAEEVQAEEVQDEEGEEVLNKEKQIIKTESDLKKSDIWYLEHVFRIYLKFDHFDFIQELLECAKNYEKPLTKKDVNSIIKELKKHETSNFKEYNQVYFIKCTNSNEDSPGQVHFEQHHPKSFYVLDFANTDLVLHLVR